MESTKNTPRPDERKPLKDDNWQPTKKLEKYYQLSFAEFLKELEKQKIKLSLPQKSEWQEYFEVEKSKIQELEIKINQVDQQIEELVRGLYGVE